MQSTVVQKSPILTRIAVGGCMVAIAVGVIIVVSGPWDSEEIQAQQSLASCTFDLPTAPDILLWLSVPKQPLEITASGSLTNYASGITADQLYTKLGGDGVAQIFDNTPNDLKAYCWPGTGIFPGIQCEDNNGVQVAYDFPVDPHLGVWYRTDGTAGTYNPITFTGKDQPAPPWISLDANLDHLAAGQYGWWGLVYTANHLLQQMTSGNNPIPGDVVRIAPTDPPEFYFWNGDSGNGTPQNFLLECPQAYIVRPTANGTYHWD